MNKRVAFALQPLFNATAVTIMRKRSLRYNADRIAGCYHVRHSRIIMRTQSVIIRRQASVTLPAVGVRATLRRELSATDG